MLPSTLGTHCIYFTTLKATLSHYLFAMEFLLLQMEVSYNGELKLLRTPAMICLHLMPFSSLKNQKDKEIHKIDIKVLAYI